MREEDKTPVNLVRPLRLHDWLAHRAGDNVDEHFDAAPDKLRIKIPVAPLIGELPVGIFRRRAASCLGALTSIGFLAIRLLLIQQRVLFELQDASGELRRASPS